MNKFYDTHSHILFGVDDGSEDLEMSIVLGYRGYLQGTRHILATPHSSAFLNGEENREKLHRNFRKLSNTLTRLNPDLKVGLGCEILCERSSIHETVKQLQNGILPTLNGSKYVLVEFGENTGYKDIWYCVNGLKDAGYRGVLAHVERYKDLRAHPKEIYYLREAGCLCQMNTSSLHHASPDRHWARQLLQERRVDFLGTDTHNTYSFPPQIEKELASVKDICDDGYLYNIMWGNAENLLHP